MTREQRDLFGPLSYPSAPGHKGGATSQEAARRIAGHASHLRAAVLRQLAVEPDGLTADEIAKRLNESVLSVRPRVSELLAGGLIERTRHRRRNASGMSAAVWMISPAPRG
jgi:predicted ArsR family transcriptional regulator